MKRVLIVTYYWPPSGGPGVQRCLKFVKYLRRFNIEPVIVTVDENKASYPVYDESLAKEIPQGVKVYRTNSFEPLQLFSSLFKKEKVPYAAIPDRDKMSAVGKLSLYIRANFFIPDARKGWNSYAFRQCCEIIEKEKIDAVFTSSPPHSTQLIGLKLKKKFNLRWIADLRDPWTDIYYYHKFHHSDRAKRKDLAYESAVLNTADAVVVTSDHTAGLFAKKTKDGRDRIHVIANGYDEEDFEGIVPFPQEKFVITFVGTIGMQFGIAHFVSAVKKLIAQHNDIPVEVRFVVKTDVETKQLLESQLGSHLHLVGYVSHKESVRYICSSQLLLLVIPQGENYGTVPGKTFEYMASRKPVICLAPKGSSAEAILDSCDAGQTFTHEDESGMMSYIGGLMQKWKRGEPVPGSNDNFKKYSRQNQTGLLAQLLNH